MLLLLAVLLGVAACASKAPTDTAAASTPTASTAAPGVAAADVAVPGSMNDVQEEYRIGPQDLLELQVFGVEALNRTVRVNSRGFISLPLIGVTRAAGLTSEQLEQSLSEQLARDYLQNPQVSVFIKEYTSQRVTVEGSVKKPGVYPIKGRTTLLQVLATAEGLTSVADPSDVKVFRADAGGNRQALVFDLEQIRQGAVRDPEVRNDDIVQVGESKGKAVAKELIEFILPFRVLGTVF